MKYKLIFYTFFCLSCSINASDFDQLNTLINLYVRPITLLAHTNNQELVIALAKLHKQSVVVWLNSGEISTTPTLLPSNFIQLTSRGNIKILNHLSESEHFDIVFVENHINELSRNYANTLYNLGENILVKIHRNEQSLLPSLNSLKFKTVERNRQGSRLMLCNHRITFLKRTQWLEHASNEGRVRHILSTYEVKKLYKNYGPRHTSSDWIPGINLMTFKMMNGRVPFPDTLNNEIIRLSDVPHSDWMPNNIIVQGNHLELIDFDDPNCSEAQQKTVHTPHMLALMQQLVTEPSKDNIPVIFESILRYCRFQIHGRKITRRKMLSYILHHIITNQNFVHSQDQRATDLLYS